ncbi:polysaccharide lyase family 8 super-sandwich domain-containing protein [Paenibacillus solani]|uniref:Polysaccharide lyase n=1 Tax=Paenibacillus solani TaxID=1705565 RepID=A0A0M1P766_9BACL|nr:polysaccharide lyase family 8 super-sandwich domain-containing protein [Paenibacillus solani]KOR90326.1 polysaccharide lyase [Paenibacillus solani]
MKKYSVKLLVLSFLIFSLIITSFPAVPAAAAAPQANDFEALRMRWFDYLTGGSQIDLNDADIRNAVEANAQKVTNDSHTGVWDTLNKAADRTYLWADYNSTTAPNHITLSYNRLKDMAIAFATPGTSLYQNEALKNDIIAGLDWMYEYRFNETKSSYGNWWEWEIGSPLSLADIVTLMHDHLSPEQIAGYTRTIDRFSPDPTKRLIGAPGLKETGANLLDKSLAVLLRGVLDQNETKIVQARNSIGSVFPYVTNGDGFYEDGSFIQHNNIAYTGSYGSVLLGDISKLLTVLSGSSWTIQDPNFDHVWDWVTDSFEPVIYDGHIMEMVSGRAVSRYNNNTRGAVWTILRLAQYAPQEQAAYYKSMVKDWAVSDKTMPNMYEGMQIRDIVLFKKLMSDASIVPRGDLIAHRQFSAMDRIIHSRPGYTLGISMSSSRIANFEGMNGEHSRGWYTGDGMTYLYNHDSGQFRDAFWPTVDSHRMPGTTSDGVERSMIKTTGKTWVGGSSMDSSYGIAGMDLAPPGSKLTGKKSWFMFDNEIVSLGAGITTSDERKDGRQVETIVENRMINAAGSNPLTVNGQVMPSQLGWSDELKGVNWAHLAGTADGADIGYYFPENSDIRALRESRTGSWKDINTSGPADPITRNYVSLAVEHGTKPADAAYSYVLLPTLSADATRAYSENPDIRILSNTAQMQAVEDTKLGLTGINFWQSGELGRVRAYQPASVMVKEQGDELTVSVSDPTQTQSKVKVEVAAAALEELAKDPTVTVLRTSPSVQLEIATGGTKGRSHVVKFKVNSGAENELPEEGALEPDDAAKIRINVSEDTFVNGGSEDNTNFGTRGFLNIRNGSGNYDRRVFLKFDLSQISDDIERAVLHVYGKTNDNNGTQSDIGVFAVHDDSWKEDTITYKNKPGAGEQVDLTTMASPDQWWTFNITPFVQTKLQDNKTVSLALQQIGRDLHAEIRSRKNEGGKYQAYLDILLKDTTAPTTTVQMEGSGETEAEHYKEVVLHFSAKDNPNGWGVLRTEYRIGGGKWRTVKDGKLVIQEQGVHTIEYRSVDKAGNVEDTQSIVVSITQPTVEINGPDKVTGGEPLIVKYGIKSAVKDMYAHDLTLQYDADLLTFVSGESLQEGVAILDTRNDSGQLRLILAGKGQPMQGNQDLIKLTFDTNQVEKTMGSSIDIIGARIGDVRGDEVEAVSSPFEYTLKANAEEPGEPSEPGGPGEPNQPGEPGEPGRPSKPGQPQQPGHGSGNNAGDANKAKISDLEQLAKLLGHNKTSVEWEQIKALDVNGDGKIDVIDLATIAREIAGSSDTSKRNSPQGPESFHLSAKSGSWKEGDTVKLTLTGKNVKDLYAYEVKLGFDLEYLEFTGAASALDGFTVSPIVKDGVITFLHTMTGNIAGEEGDIEISDFTFKVKKTGATEVRLDAMTAVDHKLSAQDIAVGKSVQIGETEDQKAVVFSDVQGHWSQAKIEAAVQKGLIKGYADGTFAPDKPITRAEFTALLSRGLDLREETELAFTDASHLPQWAASDIAKGIRQGFITGYADNTFRPNQAITRMELATMAAKALDLTNGSQTGLTFADADEIPVWARGWIFSAVNEGLLQGRGVNHFAPTEHATRAEAVTVLLNVVQAHSSR